MKPVARAVRAGSQPLLSLLGLLLHIANSRPPILREKAFYELKTALLHRFGARDGYDIQRITKTCYACKGTGIYRHEYYGRMLCNRCWSGVYQDSLIKLDRWRLGGYAFHEPADRIEHSAHCELANWRSGGGRKTAASPARTLKATSSIDAGAVTGPLSALTGCS